MIFNLMKPVPIADVEPDEPTATMYSYNGVVLSDINKVWTDELKAQYPYAVITEVPSLLNPNERYELSLHKNAPYAEGMKFYYYPAKVYKFAEGEWVHVVDAEYDYYYRYSVWSNVDVIDKKDNTIWCIASEPIPIYE